MHLFLFNVPQRANVIRTRVVDCNLITGDQICDPWSIHYTKTALSAYLEVNRDALFQVRGRVFPYFVSTCSSTNVRTVVLTRKCETAHFSTHRLINVGKKTNMVLFDFFSHLVLFDFKIYRIVKMIEKCRESCDRRNFKGKNTCL